MNERIALRSQTAPSPSFTPARSGLLQRKCACGGVPGLTGECDDCRRKRLALQHRTDDQAEPSTVPPIVQEVLRSPGQPLGADTRAFVESRFGHDFSRVRIHADARAAESARAVNALAYTVGRDVVFGAGQYAPETMHGRKLLAHELAHVMQQRDTTYPLGGLTLSDPMWEREADSAAEAAVAGRPAHVAQHAAGPQLARQKLHTETLTAPADAAKRKVEVTRAVTPGKCAEVPVTRTTSDTQITRSGAAIEVSYCRGRTRAEARGELDYSDVVRRAVNAAPNFFTSGNPQQALSDLERSFKQAEPRANVRFGLQVGGTKVGVTGTGTASVEGGVSGRAGATVGGRIGSTGVEVEGEVSGGTQEATQVGVKVSITPGAGAPEIPNCFKCVCEDPKITFACVAEPGTPDKTPPSQPKQILYVPLFFEYELTVPRTGREADYWKALDSVVERLREGYTIARIEGRTSPEGPLAGRRGFEGGNIKLARSRGEQAQKDLQAALDKAIGREEFKGRDRDPETIRRLREARSASYEVEGQAPGGAPSSAELFGVGKKGEVSERDMLEHLRETLKAPEEGKPDPLAEAHVIGEGLPPDVRAEVEAEVRVFREDRRGGKALKDRELLETIYRPLRRALVVLNPPQPKPFLAGIPRPEEELQKVVGKPLDRCLPEHEAVFAGRTIPYDWLYEGKCRPEGGVGGRVK